MDNTTFKTRDELDQERLDTMAASIESQLKEQGERLNALGAQKSTEEKLDEIPPPSEDEPSELESLRTELAEMREQLAQINSNTTPQQALGEKIWFHKSLPGYLAAYSTLTSIEDKNLLHARWKEIQQSGKAVELYPTEIWPKVEAYLEKRKSIPNHDLKAIAALQRQQRPDVLAKIATYKGGEEIFAHDPRF